MFIAALLPGLIALSATLVIRFAQVREQRRASLNIVHLH